MQHLYHVSSAWHCICGRTNFHQCLCMTVAEYSRNEEKHHLEALLSICGVQVKYKYAKKELR